MFTYFPIAAARDSAGNLNVIVLNSTASPPIASSPAIVTQSPNGTWSAAAVVPAMATKEQFTSLAAAMGTNGILQVFLLGMNGTPYVLPITPGAQYPQPTALQLPPSNLPPANSTFTAIVAFNFKSTLYLFLRAAGGTIVILTQSANGSWQQMGAVGGIYGSYTNLSPGNTNSTAFTGFAPAIANGLIQVIGTNSNNSPGLVNFFTQGATPPSPWIFEQIQIGNNTPLSESMITMAVGPGNQNQLQAVFLGTDGNAYLLWEDTGGNWHTEIPANPPQYFLPNPNQLVFTSVVTGVGHDSNKLQVILLNQKDNMPYLIWQNTDGTWNWYGKLPCGTLPNDVVFIALATGIGNDSNKLQLFALGSDGHLYLIWQDVNGTWNPYKDGSGKMISLV